MRNRDITCPFCNSTFAENCEYVDIGVGFQQCTPNFCENCQAYESYPDEDGKDFETLEFKYGWTRMKDQR